MKSSSGEAIQGALTVCDCCGQPATWVRRVRRVTTFFCDTHAVAAPDFTEGLPFWGKVDASLEIPREFDPGKLPRGVIEPNWL